MGGGRYRPRLTRVFIVAMLASIPPPSNSPRRTRSKSVRQGGRRCHMLLATPGGGSALPPRLPSENFDRNSTGFSLIFGRKYAKFTRSPLDRWRRVLVLVSKPYIWINYASLRHPALYLLPKHRTLLRPVSNIGGYAPSWACPADNIGGYGLSWACPDRNMVGYAVVWAQPILISLKVKSPGGHLLPAPGPHIRSVSWQCT